MFNIFLITESLENIHVIYIGYFYRYAVKALLQHDFFLEDSGLKVEIVNKDKEEDQKNPGMIKLQLRVVDPKKRKTQHHKENEAIQFDYSMDKDHPEEVSHEMVRASCGNNIEVY